MVWHRPQPPVKGFLGQGFYARVPAGIVCNELLHQHGENTIRRLHSTLQAGNILGIMSYDSTQNSHGTCTPNERLVNP